MQAIATVHTKMFVSTVKDVARATLLRDSEEQMAQVYDAVLASPLFAIARTGEYTGLRVWTNARRRHLLFTDFN